jgi:hypothetical protein
MNAGNGKLSGLLKRTKGVIKHRDRYLAIRQAVQPVLANLLSRLNISQHNPEDSAMPNIKTITVTYHIDEDTGKVVNATRYDGRPGDYKVPQGAITDCQAFVVSRNSPSCIYIQIGGVWYAFCT